MRIPVTGSRNWADREVIRKALGKSRGTRGCMALAAKAGIEVVNYGSEA